MTSGTPGSKRKAIAAIYDDAPTSVTKVRNMKDRSIEQKVRRAIEDHLSGWSDYQKYEMVVGGKTACERITEAKQAHAAGESRDTGKLFYAKLGADYGVQSTDLTALAFTETEPVPEEVLLLYSELLKSNPDRSLVSSFCKLRKTCTEPELKVMCHCLLSLNPNGNGDQFEVGWEVLRLLYRAGLHNKSSMLACVVTRVDDFVLKAWRHYKYTAQHPLAFIKENEDVIYLLLDEKLVTALESLEEKSKLTSRRSELHALYENSRIGNVLFASAYRVLVSEDLDQVVKNALKKLAEYSIVEQKAFQECLAWVSERLKVTSGMHLLDGRREVKLSYHGIEFSMVAKNAMREAEMKMELCVRSAASLSGALDPLPGELLVRNTESEPSVKVDARFVQKALRARRQLKKIVLDKGVTEENMSYEDIEAAMRLHHKMLKGLDPAWEYDEAILSSMAQKSESILQQSWLRQCTRQSSPSLTVNEAMTASTGFIGADLAFFPPTLRLSIESAHGMLKRFQEGEIIQTNRAMSEFLTTVLASLEAFVDFPYVLGSSIDDNDDGKALKPLTKLTGKALLQEALKQYGKNMKPKDLSSLSVFSSFRHLLSTSEIELVTTLRDELLDQMDMPKPSTPASSKPVAKAKPKSKASKVTKAETAENLQGAALAILRMKKSAP